MGNTCYQLLELNRIIGVYTTEDMSWDAAEKEFAVIHYGRGQMELASGYKIEKVKL